MISPIGAFLTRFDAAILAGMNAGITALTAYAALPVATSLAIYYIIQGVKIANGDGGPVQHFVTQLVRNVTILWFCSQADVYNKWVRDFFFLGLPDALNHAIMKQTVAGAADVANGVTGTAAVFDQVWDLMNVQVAHVYAHADFFDVASKLGAQFCGVSGGAALLIISMVYLLTRFILAIMIELGVLAVACLIFDATKSIFERWLGKVIALVFLQVAAIVVLQIVITIDQDFMKQISEAQSGTPGVPSEVQALISMVVLFFMGAFAIYSLPAIAYSIGTGVSVNVIPPLYLAAKAARGMGGLLGGGAGGAGEEGAARRIEHQRELPGGAPSTATPPPAQLPPPPVSPPHP